MEIEGTSQINGGDTRIANPAKEGVRPSRRETTEQTEPIVKEVRRKMEERRKPLTEAKSSTKLLPGNSKL